MNDTELLKHWSRIQDEGKSGFDKEAIAEKESELLRRVLLLEIPIDDFVSNKHRMEWDVWVIITGPHHNTTSVEDSVAK